ncbi:hypothetical protein ACFE04_014559 [Oxalis oulophora]
MSRLNFTIQALNIRSEVTPEELILFFSYCGTVEKLLINRKNEQCQSALITFRQPFAYQTALLLDNAILAGEPVCIVPAKKNDGAQQHISSAYAACNLWLQQMSLPSNYSL